MIEAWGWREILAALSLIVLLLEIHRRASRAMDAAERIERRLDRLERERYQRRLDE